MFETDALGNAIDDLGSQESIGEPGESNLEGLTDAGFGTGGDEPWGTPKAKKAIEAQLETLGNNAPGISESSGALVDFLTPNTPLGWGGYLLGIPATLGGNVALQIGSRALGGVDALVGKDFKNLEEWGDWTSPSWTKADPPVGTPPPGLPPSPGPDANMLPVATPPPTAARPNTDFTRTAQRGGLMDLQHQAHNVAAQGRGGDSMLVHMRPDEVAGLQALGGITRNPQTGMPEHFLGSLLGGLGGLALAPFTGGMSAYPWLWSGLGSGLGQFGESKMRGEENAIEKGLTSGLLAGLGSWGLGKLSGSAHTDWGNLSRGQQWKAGGEPLMSKMAGFFPQGGVGTGMEGLANIGAEPFIGAAGMGLGSGAVTDMMMPYMPEIETGKFTSTAELTPRYKRTARDLSEEDLRRYGMGPEGRFFSTQYLQGGGLAEVGAMMEEAGPGGDVVAEEVTAQAVSAIRGDHPEPEKAVTEYVEMFGEESFGRLREMVVQEMQVESAGGREEIETEGMISGPGAGRDDLIRGSIEGEEELRVSDGEFIVPADVVSGIGDGSSDAGAKRLYAMLDRVRQTRTGTNKQPGRVNEQEMLPA